VHFETAVDIHRQFHYYMSAILIATGLESPNRGEEFWEDRLQSPASRDALKRAMLRGADEFDRWCAGRARERLPGTGRGGIGSEVSLRLVLEDYFRQNGW